MQTTKLLSQCFLWAALFLLLTGHRAVAVLSVPGGSPEPGWLDYWGFGDTNGWVSARTNGPVGFTNVTASPLGNGFAWRWTARTRLG